MTLKEALILIPALIKSTLQKGVSERSNKILNVTLDTLGDALDWRLQALYVCIKKRKRSHR